MIMGRLRQQFAKRLKELRQQKNWTQEDLSIATGLSVSFIRAIEQTVNTPSFDSIEAIATALDLDVKDLFDFN